jgi:2-methylcitrate dehydratase PrpD
VPETAATLRGAGLQQEGHIAYGNVVAAARGAGAGAADKLDAKLLDQATSIAMKNNPKWFQLSEEDKMQLILANYRSLSGALPSRGGVPTPSKNWGTAEQVKQ